MGAYRSTTDCCCAPLPLPRGSRQQACRPEHELSYEQAPLLQGLPRAARCDEPFSFNNVPCSPAIPFTYRQRRETSLFSNQAFACFNGAMLHSAFTVLRHLQELERSNIAKSYMHHSHSDCAPLPSLEQQVHE